MQRLARRLDSRLFVSHLLVAGSALLLVGLVGLASLIPLQRELLYRQLTDAVLPGTLVARVAPQGLPRLEAQRERLPELLTAQAAAQDLRLVVVDRPQQTIRYDSAGRLDGATWPSSFDPGRPRPFPLPWQRLTQLPEAARGTVRLEDGLWLYVAIPLRVPEGDTGLLLAALAPRPTLRAAIRPLVRIQLLVLMILLILLVSVLSAWMARAVSAALTPVIAGTQAIAQGDLSHRVSVTPHAFTEAGVLADSFNQMAAEVERSRQAQRALVANVGHDLKTPLTSIQGFAQALADGTAQDPAQQARAVAIIQQEAARLGTLIDELLDLARLDADRLSLQRRRVDAAALITRLVAGYTPRRDEAQITLVWDAPAEPVWIHADADRLARVMANLLDNAFTHTPPGGRITIDLLRQVSGPAGVIEIGVADTGPGIPQADQFHVFDRFYQVDKARSGRRGAGLGLAIVRELVEAHGGQVGVTSIPGTGSRFWLRLPQE